METPLAADVDVLDFIPVDIYLSPTSFVGWKYPTVTVTLSYGSTTIGTDSATIYSTGWYEFNIAPVLKLPKGAVLKLDLSVTMLATSVTVYYNSSTYDSRIEIPTDTSLVIESITIEDDNNTERNIFMPGENYTVIARVSNPFGANEIGIYLIENPTPENAEEEACYSGPAGQFSAFVVLDNPWNFNTDSAITLVGGFEFRIEWAAGLFVTPVIHPSATNFQTPPDFYCGASIPVVGAQCTLINLTIGTFTTDPALWFLSPVSNTGSQSIPGAIAITDGNDAFSISQAFPVSGDFAEPVFGMFTCVVANEDVTWGSVKSMFQ